MANDDIQGTVTDANGNAVGGAIVALWDQDNPREVVTTTADSNGDYIFTGHPDGDGTATNWHVAARDPNDGTRQFPSLHSVSAQISIAIPDSQANHQWNFNEGSGTTVSDSKGSLDAPFTDITWGPGVGVDDTFASLDGIDDAADLGSASRTALNHWADGKGTVAMWVKLDLLESSIQSMMSSGNSKTTNEIAFHDEGNGDLKLRLTNGDGTFYDANSGTGTLVTDTWMFCAGTADGSTSRVYFATVNDSSISEVGSRSLSNFDGGDLASNVGIGFEADGNTRYWAGDISISFVDNVARSQSELDTWFNDTKGLFQ